MPMIDGNWYSGIGPDQSHKSWAEIAGETFDEIIREKLRPGYYWVRSKKYHEGTPYVAFLEDPNTLYPVTIVGSDEIYHLEEFIFLKRIPDYE